MRTILLTKGKYTIIDDNDFEKVNKFKWHARNCSGKYYAVRTIKNDNGKQETIYLHRFILGIDGGQEVDHINGVSLDNRRSNLRACSTSENCRNKPIQKNNKSGYKGVCWDKGMKKWRANIYLGKQTLLGYFDLPEMAARAYDEAARECYAEFSHTNNL